MVPENFKYLDPVSLQALIDAVKSLLQLNTDNDTAVEKRVKELENNSSNYFNDVVYQKDENKIVFKNGNNIVSEISTVDFVKDGMVEDVILEDNVLKITFNADGDNKTIDVPLNELFDVNNYYTKDEINSKIENLQEKGDYLLEQDLEPYAQISYVKEIVGEINTAIDELRKTVKDLYDDAMISKIKTGGKVELDNDVYVKTGELTLTKNTEIDLNGNEISAAGGTYGDTIVIGNGAEIVLSNGEIVPSDKASTSNASATVLVKTASASKLTLNNVKVTGIYPLYVNSANENTQVTINGGEFYTTMPLEGVSSDKMAPAVYVGKGSTGSVIGGKVTITNGIFGQPGVVNNFLLNVEDVLRKQEGKEPRNFIEVFGGKYYNFDPSNNKAEGEETNFVAEGYTVTVEEQDNDKIYTVIPIE